MTKRTAVVGVVLAAIAIVLVLNVTGLVRYPGGPLKESQAGSALWLDLPIGDQSRNAIGFQSDANVKVYTPIYVGAFLPTGTGIQATIEQLHLVDPSAGIALVDSRIGRPGSNLEPIGAFQGEVGSAIDGYQSLPQVLAGDSSYEDGALLVVTVATEPGEQSYAGVAVDYSVGPFKFTATYGPSLHVCIQPMPEGTSCSVDLGLDQ